MLRYESGTTKESLPLYSDHIKGRIKKAGFYDYDWDVDVTKQIIGSKINGFGKKAKEYSLIVDFIGNKEERAKNADTFFEMIERDVLFENIGRLYFKDYYIDCFIIGSSSGGRDKRYRMVQKEAKIYAPYPFWTKENSYSFSIPEASSANNKQYPYKYPYRYANGLNNTYVINPHFVDANFKMIIYGPAINPMVVVGGNSYLVNIVLEESERLEIDSRTGTILKIMSKGETVNAFHNREKKRTFFQKIKPGRQSISWTGDFAFDLVIYEERSEPKWSS